MEFGDEDPTFIVDLPIKNSGIIVDLEWNYSGLILDLAINSGFFHEKW